VRAKREKEITGCSFRVVVATLMSENSSSSAASDMTSLLIHLLFIFFLSFKAIDNNDTALFVVCPLHRTPHLSESLRVRILIAFNAETSLYSAAVIV
jgi:hypothetical protein